MKTLMLRVCYLGLAVTAVVLSPGAKENANADIPDPVADVLPPLLIADVDPEPAVDYPAPLAAPPVTDTNAPTKPPIMVQPPTPPSNLKLSPGLAEVVKLVQAGVGEDVLMAYITNSSDIFAIDSDTIVYLNDLGVANGVITALIQHDSSPETAARKASATAVQPLPPGVATTKPVQDVYPPAAPRTFPATGQTTYPGDFSTVTDTNPPASELPPAVETVAPATENVTVNHFYSSLAPYGTWMDVEGYGLCWQPTVAVTDPYWRPYSHRGRWLWSDYGWYWYSDYSWGWGPFHYGRWCSYPRVGWLWVPGTVWGPSWVTWRYSGSYCGWAPLPPGCGYRSGIGLTWYGSGVSIGFDFGLGSHCYTYVPVNRFCDWNVRRHCLPDNELHVVHRSARQVNRISARNGGAIVNHGIEANTIARASRTKIPTTRVKDGGPLPVNQGAKPERIENNGRDVAVVRPQLPKNPPPVTATRGSATKAQPVNLANPARGGAVSAARPQPASPLANTPAARANANRPAPSPLHPPQTQSPSQGTANRHGAVALAPPPSTPNRPAVAQPNRPQTQPQATPNAAPRNVNPAPAQRNPSPLAQNSTPAPAPRNVTPPPARSSQPAARPNPAPQTAPRSNPNPGIRSFAQPQASAPQARYSPLHPSASARPAPSAPQAVARPQFSAPAPASRPSVAPSAPARSAPPAARSAPSGGGGSRSSAGGGRNRD